MCCRVRLCDVDWGGEMTIRDGSRVEVSRGGEWITGTVVALFDDIDRGLGYDVDLDRPDASGITHIWVTNAPHRIRLAEAQVLAAAE